MKQTTAGLLAIGALLAGIGFVLSASAAPYPPALGGTGTNLIPASGTVPIGNGAGTYTPAFLICSGGCSITNASGSITIKAASTSAITTNTGNWAGPWQNRNFSDVLPSSTQYVSSVNALTGAVTLTFPATTTINGTQSATFALLGTANDVSSTVNGSTTTFDLSSIISAGSCTNCNLTYDAKGRITVAANGSAGGGGGLTTSTPTTPGLAYFQNGNTLSATTSYVASFNGATGTVSYSSPATTTIALGNTTFNGPNFVLFYAATTSDNQITTSSPNTFNFLLLASSTWAKVSNNLSDLTSSSSARTNLGFSAGLKLTISATGTIGLATTSISQWANDSGYLTSLAGALLVANNLSDLGSTSTARSNLGFTGGANITISATGTIQCASCLTGNQTITLSGAVTGSGATSITTTLSSPVVVAEVDATTIKATSTISINGQAVSTSTPQSLAGPYLGVSGNSLTASSTLASSSATFSFPNATTTAPYSFLSIYTNTAKTLAYVDCSEYAAATTTLELYYETTNGSTTPSQGTTVLASIACGITGASTTSFANPNLPAGSRLFAIVTSTTGTPTMTTLNLSALKL